MQTMLGLFIIAAVCSEVLAIHPCDTVRQYFETHKACEDSHLHMESSVAAIQSMCSDAIPNFVQCMKHNFTNCPAELKRRVARWGDQFKQRTCEGNQWKTGIAEHIGMISQMFSNASTTCLPLESSGDIDTDEVIEACRERFYTDQLYNRALVDKPLLVAFPVIQRLGRSLFRCVNLRIDRETTCVGLRKRALLFFHLIYHIPMGINVTVDNLVNTSNVNPRERSRNTVMAFGDPHVKVYGEQQIQTCADPGWQKYLDNNFLTLYGNNTYIRAGYNVTLIDKIELTLLNNVTGAVLGRYKAEGGQLPDHFTDVGGTTSDTVTIGSHTVTVKKRGQMVKIKDSNGGGSIRILGYDGVYPVLVVRLGEALLGASTGIFVDGCVESVNRSSTVSTRRRRATDCGCAQSGYREYCVFDCSVTGDSGLSLAGNPTSAIEEVEAEDDEITETGNGVPSMFDACALHRFLIGLFVIVLLV